MANRGPRPVVTRVSAAVAVIEPTQGGGCHANDAANAGTNQSVIADRADDFEDWLRIIVVPAVREHQPELEGRWEVLRATNEEDGTVIFTFIFRGGDPSEWHLEPLLDRALGAEGAQRAMADMSGMMKREQYGWTLAPVHL